ncbi:hypothetical protein [Lonepinella sp. BR2930]|uniref:hypothetical protein n=1 Tax=Lonepinella sp. BR2930 TaxID=3434554 RepID=UPI003F6DF2BC
MSEHNTDYQDLIKELNRISFECATLSLDFSKLYFSASEHSLSLDTDDVGVLNRVLAGTTQLGRSSCLSDLNNIRTKVDEFINEHISSIRRTNKIIHSCDLPTVGYQNELGLLAFELDNSAYNQSWYDQFSRLMDKVETTINSFSRACDDCVKQLELFQQGIFDQSILDIRKKQREEREEQNRLEKESKRKVNLSVSGENKEYSVVWKELENLPFYPENIRTIIGNDQKWLIETKDELFVSENGIDWSSLVLPQREFDHISTISAIVQIDNVWIIWGSNDKFIFSYDLLNWKIGSKPYVLDDYDYSSTKELIHCGQTWLWKIGKKYDYTYTEKGLIWDSKKEDWYYTNEIFSAEELNGEWSKWEYSPHANKGIKLEGITSIPNTELVFAYFSADWCYFDNIKQERPEDYMMYLSPSKKWKEPTFDEKPRYFSNDMLFLTTSNKKYMKFSNGFFSSEKGFEWKHLDINSSVKQVLELDGFVLMISDWGKLHFIDDNDEIKELLLDDGSWRNTIANKKMILSTYSPNEHETFLRIGLIKQC